VTVFDQNAPRIQGLAELVATLDQTKSAPVEAWDPPYRGDIGLQILGNGQWLYNGSPIERLALVRLFARVLRGDADGRYYLVTPAERVDVIVEDAPFLAVEMQLDGVGVDQQLTFRTNVDDIVRCGADHPLRFEIEPTRGGLKPYVLVRGRLWALVTRALCYDLVESSGPALAMQNSSKLGRKGLGGPSDRFGIWSGGVFFEMTDQENADGG